MEVIMTTQKWKYREHLGRQGKFRVGDLVTVTAYALTTEQNDTFLCHDCKDIVGLVVEIENIETAISHKYPIKVDWIHSQKRFLPSRFFYRELKLKRT